MEKRKAKRHEKLKEYLTENAFFTDEQLAEKLGVSVQTIRLDRIRLNIPELRERMKSMARNASTKLKAIASNDIVGDLIDLDLGISGVSVLTITSDMVNNNMGIARGNYMFAQANSLALALVDAPAALTGVANIKYKKPVYLGERLIAKAKINRIRGNKYFVAVNIRNDESEVFRAKFIIVSLEKDEERGLK
ncbi:transcription factor FapR [Succinispira mobilis]|uniref:transcription factor FapR n=1 Tax=Succinispira mobilis TaxID=78120 RepID=UPI000374DE7C|nr:transcription factor FapR [Succinispira mobilis]